MNDPRYQDLIAKSAHGVEGTDESAPITQTTGIEVDIFPHNDGSFTAAVKNTNWSLNRTGGMVYLGDEWGEILIFADELEIVTALLQRAREIMTGGR